MFYTLSYALKHQWGLSCNSFIQPQSKNIFSPTFLWSMHNGQKSKSAGHNAKENWKSVLMVDFYLKLWKIMDFDLFLFQVWTSNRNIFNEIFIFGPNCLHEKHNTVKTAVEVFFFLKLYIRHSASPSSLLLNNLSVQPSIHPTISSLVVSQSSIFDIWTLCKHLT